MSLNGEIQPEEEERKVADSFNLQTYSIGIMFPHSQSHDLVVGCALTFKKKKSFLQPKLLCLARNKGIFFVAIDLYRPLSDQGPFMLFYIRITGKKILKLTVLEPPYAIEHLHNRQSMLQDVADLNLSDCHERIVLDGVDMFSFQPMHSRNCSQVQLAKWLPRFKKEKSPLKLCSALSRSDWVWNSPTPMKTHQV